MKTPNERLTTFKNVLTCLKDKEYTRKLKLKKDKLKRETAFEISLELCRKKTLVHPIDLRESLEIIHTFEEISEILE